VTADLSLLLASSAKALRDDPAEAKRRFHDAAVRNDPNPGCPHCGKRHRTVTADQCADRAMLEATLTARVLYRARKYDFKGAHAKRAYLPGKDGEQGLILTPMPKGWPDWGFFKAGHRPIFLELKREQEDATPEQLEWLQLLAACGCAVGIIRPSDLREGRVEAIFKQGSPLRT
jgi:hypothetical protein